MFVANIAKYIVTYNNNNYIVAKTYEEYKKTKSRGFRVALIEEEDTE